MKPKENRKTTIPIKALIDDPCEEVIDVGLACTLIDSFKTSIADTFPLRPEQSN